MAAPPFSSSSPFFTYDVFLSFRGPDTRHGFTGFLYKALSDRGIRTFIDDEELQRGHQITPSLLSAIEGSRIAIPVFSANYASSSFCLDELSHIIDCIKGTGRLILPVFYEVDPCDVRHQRGPFGEALGKHEEKFKDKVQKWKEALHQAANLSGFHFNHGDGYEYEFIKRIVDEVSSKINRVPLHVADYLVGMESRVLKVNSLLDVGSGDGVHMVGIYGIGGMGKSTLARAVYNSVADYFDGLCFLEDVRENSNEHGLLHLQETLLSEMVGEKDIKISSVSKGISIIKHRLQQKKVLLILDDVNKLEQLQAIAGGSDWFGSGSRVLITTRDKHLLSSYGVERKYKIKDLNGKEALELLSWNAFKDDKFDPSYLAILNRAIAYASGLPLALQVIGSNLFGKSIEKWKSALNQYERIPNKEIQKILRVSFDALEEDEQNVFLDIACCFKGFPLLVLEDVLRAHHSQCMKYHIEVLIEKSLITIKENHLGRRVTTHDLIGDMGKEIVRQESPKEPGKRSRLWLAEDIVSILEDNTGTSNIEIIYLHSRKVKVVKWDGQAFNKMTNLKTLIIRKGYFLEGPKQLPESLKVLAWWEYPSQSLPPNFHPKKLSMLRLPASCLMSIGLAKLLKMFVSMRFLDFRQSKCITEIPDVSGMPNLEKISFQRCENLIKIHESIGFLNKLRGLFAFGCCKLSCFPPLKLASLQELELSHCRSLESFPEILGKMENITNLNLRGTPIKALPSSIRNLCQLKKIQLYGCGLVQIELPSSIAMLPKLEQLGVYTFEVLGASKQDKSEEKVCSDVKSVDLQNCKISDEFLPIVLTWFANMKELNLSSCYYNFTILPACIKECRFMRKLNLKGCRLLEEIRGIPPNLEILYAEDCISLRYLDLTLLPACTKECHFLQLKLDNCKKLEEIRGIRPNLEFLSAVNCKSLTPCCRSMLLNEELHEAGKKFYFPETTIPDWFEHRSKGRSIYFWFRNKIPAICLCIATRKMNNHFLPVFCRPKLIINHKKEFLLDKTYSLAEDHMLIFGEEQITFEDHVGEILENKWNHAVLSIDVIKTNPMDLVALEIGLHVFKQKSNTKDIRFTYPLISDDLKTFGSINHPSLKRKRTD